MHSTVAHLAPLFGALGVLGLVLGPLLAQLGWISPIGGFLIFAGGGLLDGLLALILGIVGAIRTRPAAHRTGAAQAWAGIVLGIVLLGTLFLLAPAGDVPPIHDLTTNPDDPPRFVAVAALPELAGHDWSYPHGNSDTAALQRTHYPDLEPIELAVPPDEGLRRCRLAAERLGWSVIAVDAEAGRLEASERTALFGFVDDIVMRVRESAGGSVIDVRSTSRVGQSDLGANAERIRAFRDELARW